MNNDELIRLLKSTKKMSNKYLAKRIRDNDERNIKEQEIINSKVSELLLSLFSEDTKKDLMTLDAVIKLLARRISEDSGWKVLDDLSFSYESFNTDKRARVVIVGDSYETTSCDNAFYFQKEIEFLKKYGSILNTICDNLLEKERILGGDYSLKDESNRPLVDSLIAYLYDYSKENNYVKIRK